MRPIKFRGKRTDDNKWIFGHYYTVDDKKEVKHYIKPDGVSYLVDGNTIGQFANMYDSEHKTEIYEDDIIIADIYVNYINPYRVQGLIVFNNYCFALYLINSNLKGSLMSLNRLCNIEIIGNKHDNPNIIGINIPSGSDWS